ncbi:MAG: HEPN domain-containing protein [Eubacterium sp.]|nr:HEPN domain-containing protein [Eubacterium sp.]
MESRLIELSKYRYETAMDDLDTAKNNYRDGKYKQAVNRSYYAVFHGLRAITALDEFDSKKHSGIIAYFNKNYVKTGVFESEISKKIQSAYRLRENADYQDFFVVSKQDTLNQLDNAMDVLKKIKTYLDEKWKE